MVVLVCRRYSDMSLDIDAAINDYELDDDHRDKAAYAFHQVRR